LAGARCADAARDLYHDAVRNALIKDGWTITHDPYRLSFGTPTVYVDLAAEQILAAEKSKERIAVEIKSFLAASNLYELHNAVGQYASYRAIMSRVDPERRLFLAVPRVIMEGLLQEPIGRVVVEDLAISVLAFDPMREVITTWKP
jgi:hypothetical protein